MNKKYKEIFEELITSYYNNSFEETIEKIMNNNFIDKKDAVEVISSLCGVDVPESENYIYDLKKAITTHKVRENIIKKISNCSKDCISESGKSKCQSLCPFDAILNNPINNGQYIDYELCQNCGVCVETCESNTFVDSIEFIPIMDLLKNNQKVIAVVAPAIAGQFGDNVTLDKLRESFVRIGFVDMIEVAFAADILTIKEAVEFNHHVKDSNDLMITSCCCPMWVGMLRKVYSNLVKDVSPSVSPMIAAGRIIKSLNPDTKVVFVGPCIAKKAEAKEKDLIGAIDYVLTFQEIKSIFDAFKIIPSNMPELPSIEYASRCGRLYARTGGVSEAISETISELYPEKYKLFKAVQANGVLECKQMLNKAEKGDLNATFIEGMGCIGGCVGGPKILVSKELGKKAVEKVAYDSPIKVPTHSHIMDEVLNKINITSLKDFANKNKIEILERTFNK